MSYFLILLSFGIAPLALMWLAAPRLVWRHRGALVVIVILILLVSIPWEMAAIDRVWFYSPRVIVGTRLFNLPIEELTFFVIDGLLVGTLALLLEEKFHVHS
ncbi:MAG: lycopene cyclase domain-containing protein [Chloroflexi bacterium]|nr:lycopene cyclase domain-containing protein [Chloroflexota bacterium]MBI3340369.1 lycopene cyclase domain-containing protein [Chloroflexota bacterium]